MAKGMSDARMMREEMDKNETETGGTITRISMEEGGQACVTVRHGPEPKKPAKGEIQEYPNTSTVYMPADRAKQYKVGQSVNVALE